MKFLPARLATGSAPASIDLFQSYTPPDILVLDNFNMGHRIAATSTHYAVAETYLYADDSHVVRIYSNTDTLLHTLSNPNPFGTTENDEFASVLGISPSYTIVGARYEDEAGNNDSGKAYIYSNSTGALLYTLDNPNAYSTSASDYFGHAVAISESYAVVGAYGEDEAAGSNSGKVYIFSTSTGLLVRTLTNPNAFDTVTGDSFGWSVAISGSYVIVSASSEKSALGDGASGVAFIFDADNGNLLHTLVNPNAYDTSASDRFGDAVAISASYSAVSAPFEDAVGGSSSGAVYIFDNATGNLLHTLLNPNSNATNVDDSFGLNSISITEAYTAVGAHREDDGNPDSGAVYIFDNATGLLHDTIQNPNTYGASGTSDFFGRSVGLTDSYLVVGAPGEDPPPSIDTGVVYNFPIAGGVFGAPTIIINPRSSNPDLNAGKNQYFGAAVACSSSYTLIGAYGFSRGANYSDVKSNGRAYIYDNATGNLLYTLDNPNADSTVVDDEFGSAVAITESYAIVSAPKEDGGAANTVGVAYIFDTSNGNLLHTISNPNNYGSFSGDEFGKSVGISESYAIGGTPFEDSVAGSSTGVAYMFSTATGNLLYTLSSPNEFGNGSFGRSVGISESYAIVGAPNEVDGGKAYIFDTSNGNLLHTLVNPNSYDTAIADSFGWAVAVSGSYSVVGAYNEDHIDGSASGAVYIFDNATGNLLWTIPNPNSETTADGDQFGLSVAISGSYVAVGAPYETSSGGASFSGVVYVFDVLTSDLIATLVNPNIGASASFDFFGLAVGVSDTHLIAGAEREDVPQSASGAAYLYTIT